jgi:alpha-1,2-mannosyltransferase
MPLNRRAFEIAAIVVAVSLLGVMLYLLSQSRGMVLANGQPLFGDFVGFWSAGRAALDGHAASVHDVATTRAYQEIAAPGLTYFTAWVAPPTFLLVSAAFATLPYPAAAILFLLIGAALYLYAARQLLPDARALILAVTLPAALYHLGSVQTGLLVAGISGLALVWLDKRPLTAGALVGLLAIKPHLAILWPVMLALSGRWRAFGAAAVSTTVFVVIAGLVFGFDAYLRFFENLSFASDLVNDQSISTPSYAGLYANLVALGVPRGIATGVWAVSVVVAVFLSCLMFVRRDRKAAGAALCSATLLMSPYLFFYDFTLLGVGAALLGAPRDKFEVVTLVLAWGAGLSLALGYIAPLPLCPIAAFMVLLVSLRRA